MNTPILVSQVAPPHKDAVIGRPVPVTVYQTPPDVFNVVPHVPGASLAFEPIVVPAIEVLHAIGIAFMQSSLQITPMPVYGPNA
ncbi:MAG: hypothetical protein IPG74_10460 [Flavobacteriales bacterium]|nr:hypothetical protein [Flavobacteriales bacterium]